MKRLVYGVGLASSRWEPPLPAGPGGCAVKPLCNRELAAVYSATNVPEANPSASYLLAYARVIEQLHRRGPLAPMRFACLLADENAIRDLLRTRRDDFLAMLDEITGCDEFGLRVLPGTLAGLEADAGPQEACIPALSASEAAGARYLAGRRRLYAQCDARQQRAKAIAARVREAFAGLYVRCEEDAHAVQAGSIASLSFLVRRSKQALFHKRCRGLQQEASERLLLTGPWPPYHFVAMNRADGRS